MTTQYDLIVLGAGSGGLAAAIRAARLGARVAVVEPNDLGGTCVNAGCIPKKAMWLAARLALESSLFDAFGLKASGSLDSWQALLERREAYVASVRESYRRRLQALAIEFIPERGRFVSANELMAGDRRLTARHFLIATGARPERPSITGAEFGSDSNAFFTWQYAPKRVVIAGGGYIGVELATILQALGSQVYLLVRGARLLSSFDGGVVASLSSQMQASGIAIHTRSAVRCVAKVGNELLISLADGRVIEADALLWATGRTPNSDELGLDALDISRDARGRIRVDAHNHTNVSNIHAVGDVTTDTPLTPVAVMAGRILAEKLFGDVAPVPMDRRYIPSVLFAHPPLATVGLTEEAAREQFGSSVSVFESRFRAMKTTLANEPSQHHFKMVCAGADQRVVGLHALGQGVDEIMQGFAVAMRMGATRADFASTIAIHPGLAEELLRMD